MTGEPTSSPRSGMKHSQEMFVGYRAWKWGKEESQHPKSPRTANLKGGEVKECVFGVGTQLIDSLLVHSGRVRPAKCRLCLRERGEGWDQPSQLQTPDLGLLRSQKISVSQPKLVPRESLAELPHWEPVQSHTGEDITAFTGTEQPQICVFC